LENNLTCLYWDRGILIDKIVLHYRPDITLFEKTNKIFYLIDVSITNRHRRSHKKDQHFVITLARAFSCTMFAGKEFHKGETSFQ